MVSLTSAHARRWRHQAQLLRASTLDPVAVVDRAVALQGQDLAAVLRAIALRAAPGTTVADVRDAFDRGALVRSWPMRGTLFATTPAHLADLRALTAARTHRAAARRREQLGIDPVLEHARAVLSDALSETPLPRPAVLAAWEAAGIDTSGGRGYHLIVHLAIDGMVHWGAFDESGAQLLTLSDASVAGDADALARLLRGYIEARGPVTEADAAWWLKLPKTMVRGAADRIDGIREISVDGGTFWAVGEVPDDDPTGVTLVPGFDEWILGYADRTLQASDAAFAALVPGGNGVFRPAVLIDGVVVGSWRRQAGAEPALDLVEPVSAANRLRIADALAAWPYA